MDPRLSKNPENIKNIAILGAGVSGIQAAKLMRDFGYNVTVFDSAKTFGGVWAKGYETLRLMLPKDFYKIPHHNFDKSLEKENYPTKNQVLNYIASYVNKHDLEKLFKYNSTIIDVKPTNENVCLTLKIGNEIRNETFDFLLICQGMFYHPYIPEYKNIKDFKGKVLHSTEIESFKEFETKKVILIGFSKSAIDLSISMAEKNTDVTIVARHLVWPIPNSIFGTNYYFKLFGRRFVGDLMFPYFTFRNTYHKFWHENMAFAVNWFWKSVQFVFSMHFDFKKYNLKPNENIPQNYLKHKGFSINRNFFDLIDRNKIKIILGKLDDEFEGRNVKISKIDEEKDNPLNQNRELKDIDNIVFCTGFKSYYPYLESTLGKGVRPSMYKNTFDYRLPNIAFVGVYSSILLNLNVAVQCVWLNKVLKGEIEVNVDKIKTELDFGRQKYSEFLKRNNISSTKETINPINFNDLLLRDMKLNPYRKYIFNYFRSYSVEDYESLIPN